MDVTRGEGRTQLLDARPSSRRYELIDQTNAFSGHHHMLEFTNDQVPSILLMDFGHITTYLTLDKSLLTRNELSLVRLTCIVLTSLDGLT